MATFKAIIRKDKQRSDKTWNVVIRFTHDRKVRYISTSMYATKADITSSYKLKNRNIIDECEDLTNGDYIVFQVRGHSMLPIQDGAIILAKIIPQEKWETAEGLVFVVYGKTLTLKRILKNSLCTTNILTLRADNPIYGQADVQRSEIRGMWQAIRIVEQDLI